MGKEQKRDLLAARLGRVEQTLEKMRRSELIAAVAGHENALRWALEDDSEAGSENLPVFEIGTPSTVEEMTDILETRIAWKVRFAI